MGALHWPELEPGPHRDLVEALHRLHEEAGRPSLRALARRAGCSHTTVRHVLSHPLLPAWELLAVIVTALSGDPQHFRSLWLAATAQGVRHVPPPGRPIAGRRAELLVVRRHLEGGAGLLLVVGGAGIGKTTLVATASQQVSTFAAQARGVRVLSEAPFALVTAALREVWRFDAGLWLKEALAGCPAFVEPSLARILPELGMVAPDDDDRFAPDRLFAAIQTVLASLAAIRPLALVLEDLHWADASSLSCLQRPVLGGRGIPVAGTFQPGQSADGDEWWLRVRGEATLQLNLPPLTEKETREQLHMTAGRWLSHGAIGRIHGLSRGVPLLTEQLARSLPEQALPEKAEDSLSGQLDDLTPGARAVLVVAALADRPLPAPVVRDAAAMSEAELTDATRELVTRHLLAGPYGTSDVGVRHPLLASTVRSQLPPAEAESAHQRLATVLARTPHSSTAEIAAHWGGAQVTRQELRWRVAAARTACSRLARGAEAAHWSRVLELWPADGPAPAEAGIERPELLLEAIHATIGAGRIVDVGPWVREVLSCDPSPAQAPFALALRRASQALAGIDPESAIRLAGRAITALDELQDRIGTVRALGDQSSALRNARRYDEADEVVSRALALSAALGEPALYREVLIQRAWLDVAAGRTASGLRAAREARLVPVEDDPFAEVWLGTLHTDLLLMRCATGDDVAEAAAAGLTAVRDARIGSFPLSRLLVCNVVEARIDEGAVAAAGRLLHPHTKDAPRQATRSLHLLRAWTEVLRGDPEAADRRLTSLAALARTAGTHQQGLSGIRALNDLWRGLPSLALVHVEEGVADEMATSWSPGTGTLLVLGARAAADVAQTEPSRLAELTMTVSGWQRQFSQDPFAPDAPHAATPAARSTWRAELGRLTGTAQVAHWTGAAQQWDLVGRPHDAAYCRWRAAELALQADEGTLAARLLRRAHAQARGHVPLLRAIERLAETPPRRVPEPARRRAPGPMVPATSLLAREHR